MQVQNQLAEMIFNFVFLLEDTYFMKLQYVFKLLLKVVILEYFL